MHNLKKILSELQNVQADPAVSVFIKTHRTFPDNQQDSIALKNQLKHLEDRLGHEYDSKIADQIVSKIRLATDELDPNYNLDSLAIFATTDQVKVLRLPFITNERITIGQKFETRDFLRELSYAVNAYVVVVTREIGRLIQISNDQVVYEYTGEHEDAPLPHGAFPLQNTHLYTTSSNDRAVASNEDNYLKEFLNRVDKNVQVIKNSTDLPLIIVADRRNIGFYESVCDRPQDIIITVDNVTNLEQGSAQHIVDGIQTQLEQYRQQRDILALEALDKSYGQPLIRTDLQEIYKAAFEGNAATLYVQRGFMLSGHIDEDQQRLSLEDHVEPNQSNDVVSQVIDVVDKNGGEVVFLPEALLKDKAPVVLVMRY
ncbi:hypothetical protein EC844_10556 [Acinetobacter calcoaceticus]|uniref:Uncharacterized protein n=1 Tax=Acinetobacter calcoaceticus TaxID=471 RepID=A0A4R1Y7S6_ACICA|nr:hypothetical protein EC844_10556 [Acinetobacter calcoaceticus]